MIFQLTDELVFPNPEYAEENGLLAIGGDLRIDRLLLAYRNGIFPWGNYAGEILWYAPDPRCVMFPKNIRIHKSMRKWIKKTDCRITENTAFEEVITNCAEVSRKGQSGTWISDEFIRQYTTLHTMGFAKSIEVWQKNQLVGGLYGLQINDCFFGESMFHKISNASKYAFIHLATNNQYRVIDCQVHTDHLEMMGAEMIIFDKFLAIIQNKGY